MYGRVPSITQKQSLLRLSPWDSFPSMSRITTTLCLRLIKCAGNATFITISNLILLFKFSSWVRRHLALMFLNPLNVFHAWNDVLRIPPFTNSQGLDVKLQQFSTYFRNTWVNNNDRINLWNHWNTTGPRTTNAAEGFNNSLRSKFPVSYIIF